MREHWLALRFRLEYLVFWLTRRLMLGLGLERASRFSGWSWRIVARFNKRHRRALRHLAQAFPEKGEAERTEICFRMWENLGRNFAEAFFLERLVEEGRIEYRGLDAFARWASSSSGRVACAAHLGNWELAIAGISRAGLKPWSVYRHIKNPMVDRHVLDLRGFLYTGGLLPKGGDVTRRLLRVIRDGGTVALLADLRDRNGVPISFFGRQASSTPLPALLATSAGLPVLIGCVRRLPGIRFEQTYVVIDPPETGDRRADIAALTRAIQSVFETFIRRYPDQWMRAHNRWDEP